LLSREVVGLMAGPFRELIATLFEESPMRREFRALILFALAVCLVGCGGGDYSSPEATFNTMWEAAKAGDMDAMMACFREDTRNKLRELQKMRDEFAKEMPEMAKKVRGPALTARMMQDARKSKTEIGAQKISGNKATLEVIMDGKEVTLEFVKEKGGWKLGFSIPDDKFNKMKEAMKKEMEMMRKMKKTRK